MATKDPLISMPTVYLVAGIIAAAAACVGSCTMGRRAHGPSPWRGWETIFDEGTLAQNLWAGATGLAAVILLMLVGEAIRRWKMER
jgi:hypothetical protein